MIKIHDLINQALPLSKAKELTRGWDKSRYAEWFGGKNRIYIPLISSTKDTPPSETQKQVQNALKKSQYQIKDYIEGIAINTKYDRQQKIGKVLNKLDSDLLQKFNNDSVRQTTKNKKPEVVISRHPYDIAGMSTDRGWTSCKDLGTEPIYSSAEKRDNPGSNAKYLTKETKLLLIAYLIYPDDKNITHPIARVLMIPYLKTTLLKTYTYFNVSTNAVYGSAGTIQADFIATVKKWLDSVQGSPVKSGQYKIHKDIYNDKQEDKIALYGDKKEINYWDKDNGTWQKGVWARGVFKNSLWKKGTWYNGEFLSSVWENGTWKDGEFKESTWKNGIWERGTFEYSSFYKGRWKTGNWKNSDWYNGVWWNGNWKSGVWHKGTWENGNWYDGFWLSGDHMRGVWYKGEWVDGTWNDGLWVNGVWNGGTWVKGKIYDQKKEGNFDKSWKWQGDFVNSPINPAQYWKGKK